MSYLFTSDQMTADFGAGNEFSGPYFLGIWTKVADHPAAVQYPIAVGPASTDSDGMLAYGTADQYRALANGSNRSDYQAAAGAYDGVWLPLGNLVETDGCTCIVDNNYASKNTTTPISNMRYVSIGATLANAAPLTNAYVAEIVICKFLPTTQQITDWMGGASPDSVWSGRTDYHYWSLSTEQATHADESGNGGPTLSVASGAPAYNADHPTITGGVRYIPVVQPLYYGVTLLANKTGINYKITDGYTNLAGTVIGAGSNGTTDASGNFILPEAETLTGEGNVPAANDEVILHLYWEEGSNPVVDRSLIVKTTLAEDV